MAHQSGGYNAREQTTESTGLGLVEGQTRPTMIFSELSHHPHDAAGISTYLPQSHSTGHVLVEPRQVTTYHSEWSHDPHRASGRVASFPQSEPIGRAQVEVQARPATFRPEWSYNPQAAQDRASLTQIRRNTFVPRHMPMRLTQMKVEKQVTREIYLPLAIYDGQLITPVKGDALHMKKVASLRPPVSITLSGAMPWGGVYDGGDFLPGTAQLAIAEIVASQEWCNPELAKVAGCFLTVTPTAQHKSTLTTLGCGSIMPFFMSKSAQWRNFPRGVKVIYMPEPEQQMTASQKSYYHVKAATLNGPTVILPSVPSPAPKRQRRRRRCDVDIDEETDEEMQSPVSNNQSGSSSSWLDSVFNEVAGHSSAGNSNSDHTSQETFNSTAAAVPRVIRTSQHARTAPVQTVVRTSQQARTLETDESPMDRPGQFGASYSRRDEITGTSPQTPIVLTNSTQPPIRPPCTFDTRLSSENAFEDDTHDRELRTERLTDDYCNARAKLEEYSRGIGISIDLSPKDDATRFWDSFEAVMKEERANGIEGLASPELEALDNRRASNYGLTSYFVEEVVEKLLGEVKSLSPYSKFDLQHHFEKAAIPRWQLWEACYAMEPPLTPEQVELNFDESMEIMRNWGESSFSRPACTEQQLCTMREEYVAWKTRLMQKAPANNADDGYIAARKEVERTKRMLRVHQISDRGLYQFRRFGHYATGRTEVQFSDGGELGAIRDMCKDAIRKKSIFGDFHAKLRYISDDGEVTLEEGDTLDAGGVTNRLLTGAWKTLFDGSAEFHAAFVQGPAGLHHLCRKKHLSEITKRDIQLVGQLMFLLILKKQLVNRPMTMACVAHAMGLCPSRDEIRMQVLQQKKKKKSTIYVEDFRAFRPSLHNLLQGLMAGRTEGWEQAVQSIEDIAPEYYARLEAASDKKLSDAEFEMSMKNLYADVVYETLFLDCSTVGTLLKLGFHSLIGTCKNDLSMTETEKKLVLSSVFDGVSIKAMNAFFTAELGITNLEFLQRIIYGIDFPPFLKSMFVEVVKRLSAIETYRLYRFITDEKYVAGSVCKVVCMPNRSPLSLPQASTCIKQLQLPPYDNVDIMHSKICLASLNTAYGMA